MLNNYVSTEEAKAYRVTRHELRTHLVNSGDPFPDSTIDAVNKARPRPIVVNMGATAASDYDSFYWLKTRTLRIPGWNSD